MIERRLLLGVFAAVLAVAPHAEAQFYFGQNQVQYDSFDWKVIETDHFLVHYYPGEETAAREVLTLLDQGVARRLVADVPVGILLSGGIDSSLVAAIMQRQQSAPSFLRRCAGR